MTYYVYFKRFRNGHEERADPAFHSKSAANAKVQELKRAGHHDIRISDTLSPSTYGYSAMPDYDVSPPAFDFGSSDTGSPSSDSFSGGGGDFGGGGADGGW